MKSLKILIFPMAFFTSHAFAEQRSYGHHRNSSVQEPSQTSSPARKGNFAADIVNRTYTEQTKGAQKETIKFLADGKLDWFDPLAGRPDGQFFYTVEQVGSVNIWLHKTWTTGATVLQRTLTFSSDLQRFTSDPGGSVFLLDVIAQPTSPLAILHLEEKSAAHLTELLTIVDSVVSAGPNGGINPLQVQKSFDSADHSLSVRCETRLYSDDCLISANTGTISGNTLRFSGESAKAFFDLLDDKLLVTLPTNSSHGGINPLQELKEFSSSDGFLSVSCSRRLYSDDCIVTKN